MSQRLYTGPTSRRVGSPVLLAVAWVLAIAAIGSQIYFPIANHTDRASVAIVCVITFFAASLVHAMARYGALGFFLVGLVVPAIGLGVEALGVRTGWPFGDYTYGDALGYQLFGVPVVVPLAWAMMAYPCYVAADTLTRRRWGVAFIGAWVLTAWDVFLDPTMVDLHAWTWHSNPSEVHAILDIPAQNFVAWFLVGLLIMVVLFPLQTARVSSAQPATLFFWVFVSSIVANLFFFNRPEAAVVGGLAMALVALPYLWTLWDTRL
jgi:uncharacterized membrane protein